VSGRLASLEQHLKIDPLQYAAVAPSVMPHRRIGRELARQLSPLTASPRDIQDRVRHGSCRNLARPAQRLDRRHMRLDQRPFCIRDITCVALALSLILPPSDFGQRIVVAVDEWGKQLQFTSITTT